MSYCSANAPADPQAAESKVSFCTFVIADAQEGHNQRNSQVTQAEAVGAEPPTGPVNSSQTRSDLSGGPYPGVS